MNKEIFRISGLGAGGCAGDACLLSYFLLEEIRLGSHRCSNWLFGAVWSGAAQKVPTR